MINQIDDHLLAERVRAKLEQVTKFAHEIIVSTQSGSVTLSGMVFQSEEENIINEIAKVEGVVEVIDNLETRADPSSKPVFAKEAISGHSNS